MTLGNAPRNVGRAQLRQKDMTAMEPLATPTVFSLGLEELMPTNGVEELLPSIRTYYWDFSTIKLVLLLIIVAALFGLLTELLSAIMAYRARRLAPSH